MTTICHFSDWHGMWLPLPEADLYICTGDMLPNSLGHKTNWIYEEKFQTKFIKDNPIEIPGNKPVYCVRGNHDHVSIGGLFPNSTVREFHGPELMRDRTFGFKLFGVRGVQRIKGNSPEEYLPEELEAKIGGGLGYIESKKTLQGTESLGGKDTLFLTHCPPFNVMDDISESKAGYGNHCGSKRLWYETQKHARVHFFGHVHDSKGIKKLNGVIYSNAATGINMVEI